MAAKGPNMSVARKRVTSVFTYLQELHRVRTPPVVDLDEYEWHSRLADIPTAPSIRIGTRLREHLGERANAGEFLIRVGRPTETPAPEPPEDIAKFVAPGWEDPRAKVRLRRSKGADAEEVKAAFATWKAAWADWAESLEPQSLFSELFELWTLFERESEKYQLYIGDGMLSIDHEEGPVLHPLLMSRLELKFDASIPAFTITESAQAPEIYAPLLRHLMVDGKALRDLQKEFEKAPCDPLGGKETDQFLKRMVHTLWPHGAFGDKEPGDGGAHVYREASLFLGHRSHDLADSIDRYLETVPERTSFSEGLLRVVGIDTARPRTETEGDHALDILLTHPANPEQERVIRRLSETGAVLVQGPPGTGKSHTIANLIGHLLAENKTILVTSHASKALRVVRDKVAAPLRSLCVSVLDSDEDSAVQLEESINGILNYLSATSETELDKEIDALTEERERLKQQEQGLRKKLLDSLQIEFGTLATETAEASPADLARKLCEEAAEHGWLPGPIDADDEAPLSAEELAELYQLVADIDHDAEEQARAAPNLALLPSAEELGELVAQLGDEDDIAAEEENSYWTHQAQTMERLEEARKLMGEANEILDGAKGWVLECLAAGSQGKELAESWRTLAQMIRRAQKQIPPRTELVIKHGPTLSLDWPLEDAIEVAGEIVEHLTAGKKLSGLGTLFKREWKTFIAGCGVDSGEPETAEHFRAIQDLLEIHSLRGALARRWDRQMVPHGAPTAKDLGHDIEASAAPYAEQMKETLQWIEIGLARCERLFGELGLDWAKLIRDTEAPQAKHADLLRLRAIFKQRLPEIIDAREQFISQNRLLLARSKWLDYLERGADESGPFFADLAAAVREKNVEAYAELYEQVTELVDQVPAMARRNELLAALASTAPEWARAVRDRREPHNTGSIPGAGDAAKAWAYRLLSQTLAEATNTDINAVQTELNQVSDALRRTTARYVEKMAWQAQVQRTGLEEQQALAGWLGLHKKIGKGSGKNAARLREEAKRTLVKCRQAVPVWIMPLSRVIDNFDMASTQFDVVILDEASQCDILGLICLAMGKEIAVVGDHEQVSPYAVGHKIEKIQGLIDELLEDIPNRQLYDGKTSVYDLARQSFGGTIRLLEHFRCVPDIIQFSNNLCYGGEIQALRESSSAQVRPALVNHVVEGGTKSDKLNMYEANEIASIVAAICEQPEYEGMSIGIISMLGTEQALRIDAILRRRLTAAEYQRRRLLCGNASQFQGDERDVMLLSVVDSPSPTGKRLPIKQREELKKAFNVAASRARDQLWVVHSLDPERDLKDGDLRLKLIKHAMHPDVLRTTEADPYERLPSTFEKELAEALTEEGYKTTVHGKVGHYRIDIVVEGGAAGRAAVLCDGDREQTRKELLSRIGRHTTLKRLGWPFIRVPSARYYMDPEGTIADIKARLRELRIEKDSQDATPLPPGPNPEELMQRVLGRVNRSRAQWKQHVPEPESAPSAPAEKQEESGSGRASTELGPGTIAPDED